MSEILHHSPKPKDNKGNPRIEYILEDIESTALESVFNILFEQVEKEEFL